MFARARLDIGQAEVFVVPALAVLKLQGSNERYVFLEENGIARRVVVEMGDRFDDMVEIISDGINAGDNLIIAGQARLLDGAAVSVR
jgi:membrane fusion protein, multidrug efflux system